MLKEFKDFAIKGNLIDMAVAFVMGAAFGKVTTSFIDGMVMPLIGQIGGVDFSKAKHILIEADAAAKVEEVSIKYGDFISTVINFIIVAFAVFLMIKAINSMKKKEEVAPTVPPAPSKQEILLGEIRDLLKAR